MISGMLETSGSPEATAENPAETRVLFVDDESSVCFVVSRMLGRMGYPVEVAASADEALARVDDVDERGFGVIFVDINLGDDDGMELAAVLRQRCTGARLVAAGGDLSAPQRRAMREGLFDGLLEKPFGMENLAVSLRESLAMATRRAASSGG